MLSLDQGTTNTCHPMINSGVPQSWLVEIELLFIEISNNRNHTCVWIHAHRRAQYVDRAYACVNKVFIRTDRLNDVPGAYTFSDSISRKYVMK